MNTELLKLAEAGKPFVEDVSKLLDVKLVEANSEEEMYRTLNQNYTGWALLRQPWGVYVYARRNAMMAIVARVDPNQVAEFKK